MLGCGSAFAASVVLALFIQSDATAEYYAVPGILWAMVPLLLYGELVAIFEIGRALRPFRAREVARAEDVIEALAARSVVMGWF